MLTVADVLELDPVRRGAPRVLAGADRLDTAVRWVHVIELAEAGRLLRGGELVLSTGIALPPDPAGLSRYVAGLADAGVSALAVELGSRYVRELPRALVQAAVRHRLPLVVFERETQFIAITEAVHARILAAQVAELSAANRLYQVFTDLALAGASEQDVVERASVLAGAPVILADLGHRVLACAPGGQPAGAVLTGFASRSRALRPRAGTGYDQAAGWLVTPVRTAQDATWARLIFVLAAPPDPAAEVLAERASATLTLARTVRAQRLGYLEQPEQAASRVLLAAVAGPGFADFSALHARITAAGVPLTGHQLVAVAAVAIDAGVAAQLLAEGCAAAQVPALTGVLPDGTAGGLLALPLGADPAVVLSSLAVAAGDRLAGPIGTAAPVLALADAREALREAGAAAGAAVSAGGAAGPVVRLADLGLTGLLYQLRDDTRVVSYAERQLGPLLARDERTGTDLLRVLAVYLAAGGNKAVAAQQAKLARPTLYERLHQIEQVLGTSLDSPETRLALHVALLAHRQHGAPVPGS
jgi:PucR family transcriptional regulator, purine catabolism regulatory protein